MRTDHHRRYVQLGSVKLKAGLRAPSMDALKMRTADRPVFPALTGLRAFAAFIVFVHHYISPISVGKSFALIANEFHIGVPVFFVLSGFLITLRYSESARVKADWYGPYLRNRFARIYPVYFLITVLTLLCHSHVTLAYWLSNLSFTAGFLNSPGFVVPQAWSLPVEEMFYLSAPLLFVWLKKEKSPWPWPVLVFLLGLAIYLIAHGLPIEAEKLGYFGSFDQLMLRTFFGRSFEFVCGVLLARQVMRGALTLDRKGNVPWFTYLGLASVPLTALLLSQIEPKVHFSGLFTPWGILLNNFLFPLGVAALIYGLVSEKTWVSHWFSSRTMTLLGKSSYAFYLIHFGFLADYFRINLGVRVGIVFAICVLASVAIHKLWEEPLQRRLRAQQVI